MATDVTGSPGNGSGQAVVGDDRSGDASAPSRPPTTALSRLDLEALWDEVLTDLAVSPEASAILREATSVPGSGRPARLRRLFEQATDA